MPLQRSGQIAASDISIEFGRGVTYFDINTARNGGYGAINNASGFRPTANGQSGYEYDDWYGYHHFASHPNVYVFVQESNTDVNLYVQRNNPYGGYEWGGWFFSNTGPWTDTGGYFGSPIRVNDSIYLQWNWFGWGDPNKGVFKYVDSNQRGVIASWGCDPAQIQRATSFTTLSGEQIYCYAVDFYC
jgi:hypothetical protein